MARFGPAVVLASTRSRVLASALVLLAATIIVTVLADRAVLLSRLESRIDLELAQEADEFRVLAQQGIDPATGEPFGDDVTALFDTFLVRNVPGKDEVLIGLIDGRPYARSADPPFPVEEIDELVEHWGATTGGGRYRTDETPIGPVRSLALPVTRGSDTTVLGVFVVARFPAGERAEVDEAIAVAGTVGAAAFVVAAIGAWAVAGRVLSPLRQLADATAAIDENDLSHRIPLRGSGELADLTERFNSMLDRVDNAFAVQRAFLDDAGHELRTPITIVRGHLELLEPDRPVPSATMHLVLDELDRMARIVDDLLTMAKAERPDFVRPGPIDVADLTIEIADKAGPLGDRVWITRPEALVVATFDRGRIVQAWMNLVRNAVQHTAPGDEITVFSRTRGDAVEMGVVDTGEGVAPGDEDRLFQRFSRGHSIRRSAVDGAGLGLAIAAAIAAAHGGTIEHRRTPGGGATFVLRLPLVAVPPDPGPGAGGPGSDPGAGIGAGIDATPTVTFTPEQHEETIRWPAS